MPPATSLTDSDPDRACIERMRAGDTHALDELMGRHGDPLYSLALRIVARADLAEEVAREAWLQAWRKVATYDPERGSVGAWLVSMVRGRALERTRGLTSRERAETAAGSGAMPEAVDDSVLLAHRLRQGRVRVALAQLSALERRVLELAYFGGLSQSEIASQLATPLGTIKTWTRQALAHVREQVPREAEA